jgi:hypothetical protein
MNDIDLIPRGHRYSMITAALIKWVLVDPQLPPAEKLDFLEKLDALPDDIFTRAALVAIKPMTDAEVAMVDAAASLDGADDKRCNASFQVLTGKAFRHFASLSLAPAIELMGLREGNKCLQT